MRPRPLRVAAVIAGLALAAPLMIGAAPAPRHTGFCDSFLSFMCPKQDPEPVQTTTPIPDAEEPDAPKTDDSDSTVPADTASPQPDPEETPVPAPVDEGAPVFTGTPAAMGAGGLSFTGLRGISIVSVPTVDGSTVRALKIDADSITISGFSLTVRPPDGPGLVTTADTMSLEGNVSVYLGSVSATSLGGEGITLGLATPPALTDVEPGLLEVSMGLVGSIADSIHYTNTDQRIVELEEG
ncbi:hypothetical protein [Microbacterium sp.]|uniref:hypothetical protein n=1 Tax=Microbacterium sp. TaxID=51671 RepID=UPI003F94C795